jgi:hypothetical protein
VFIASAPWDLRQSLLPVTHESGTANKSYKLSRDGWARPFPRRARDNGILKLAVQSTKRGRLYSHFVFRPRLLQSARPWRTRLDIEQIIRELQVERGRLNRAIAVLEGPRAERISRRGLRHMSAESRARIAAAQRKRWAAQRKNHVDVAAAATAGSTRPGPRHMSAAAKERIAAAQKARWAKIRASHKKKKK